MKQETINKNKLLTILCAVALTLGVFVSAVLFSATPVHAEESTTWTLTTNPGTYDFTLTYSDQWKNNCTKDYHIILSSDSYYAFVDFGETSFVSDPDATGRMYKLMYYDSSLKSVSLYTDNAKYPSFFNEYNSEISTYYQFLDTYYDKDGNIYHKVSDNTSVNVNTLVTTFYFNKHVTGVVTFPLPVFESEDAMKNYCLTGDKSGMVSEPELPNTSDETYAFTGFTMNGKTARWTGTTERSYAKDVEVEEFVKVSYAWATTTEPDNLGDLQTYDGEFPTSDKQLTLPWSDMEKGKTDFQFIRQVKIFPCYRVPHLAFYIGQPVTIYYNADGSIEKAYGEQLPFMYPDSDTSIQGNNSIKLIDFNVTKDFKAVWSGLDGIGTQNHTHSFIEFEIGYALTSSPGNVSSKSTVTERCLVSSGSFQIPSSYTQADSKKYVLYVKATPYHYNGDDTSFRLYRGSPSYKYFDENGEPSWDYTDTSDIISGGGGLRRGTVTLNDFFLSNVAVKDGLMGYSTISWSGTTKDSDLLFVPENETLVIASYILTTKNGDDYKYTPVTYTTTTINAGKVNINVAKLVDEAKKSGEAWDMQIRLTPAYTSNGILYMGQQSVCHMTDKTVKNESTDSDGSIKIDDVTDNVVPDVDGKVEITADDLAGYTNTFVSFLKGLINAMGQIPQLIGTVFSFLPDMYRNAIGILFIVILILRILGR